LAGAGRCSLAAVPVSGGCLLFPSRYFAGAVLACVRLSSCVSSVSPVVAAVGLAVAASQWLAALGSHRAQGSNKISAGNEISLSAAAERKTKPTNHETQMRMTRNTLRLASTRAQTNSDHHLPVTPATPPVAVWRTRRTTPLVGLAPSRRSQFARSRNRFTLTTTKRATGVRDTSSNAGRRARVLSFVPAGSAPLRAPGRVSSYRTSLSAALSLPSRATEAPPVRKRAALPDLLGYRTSFAREGQHPKVSATRN